MKHFVQYDYFRKSQSPDAVRATFTGGLMSLLSVAVSAY